MMSSCNTESLVLYLENYQFRSAALEVLRKTVVHLTQKNNDSVGLCLIGKRKDFVLL